MPIATQIEPLSPAQKRVATPFVYGASNSVISQQLHLTTDSVASHLRMARKKLGCPGSSRPVLVHAILTTHQVAPPACHRPAPDFTEAELILLNAIAEHSLSADIARCVGGSGANVRGGVDALIKKACADNPTHLVGLGHAWGLLGKAAIDEPAEPDTAETTGIADARCPNDR
ncbi:LuxR C-terminal-related transcriptional regulator [Streptomyces lydicus]|uniref:LuxR C-terminal-related transcriptional regulator n=1 Tax=Streptomyces lydicus TaxID=47763 RepID=UPI0037B5935A